MFISKNINGYWYLYTTDPSGKRSKISTKTKAKGEALEFLRSFRSKPKKLNVAQSISEFKEDFFKYAEFTFSKGTVDLYKKTFKHFHDMFGNITLKSITAHHWDIYKLRRSQQLRSNHTTISPITVNIELRCLKSAINTAIRWELLEKNPFSRQKQCPVRETLPTFFTKDEIQLLLATSADVWLKEIIIFAVMTGLRQGEILHLQWQDIDFDRRTITIKNSSVFKTKTGKQRVIPVNDVVFSMLHSKLASKVCDYVFSLNGCIASRDVLTVRFKRLVKKAQISDSRLHFHSLRHTFASWLVQSGVSLYEVQKLLGHSNISVTQVYSHLLPVHMQESVNKLSERVEITGHVTNMA